MLAKVYTVVINGEIRKGSVSRRWYEQRSDGKEKIYISLTGPKSIVTNLKKHGVDAKVVYSEVEWKEL